MEDNAETTAGEKAEGLAFLLTRNPGPRGASSGS